MHPDVSYQIAVTRIEDFQRVADAHRTGGDDGGRRQPVRASAHHAILRTCGQG